KDADQHANEQHVGDRGQASSDNPLGSRERRPGMLLCLRWRHALCSIGSPSACAPGGATTWASIANAPAAEKPAGPFPQVWAVEVLDASEKAGYTATTSYAGVAQW